MRQKVLMGSAQEESCVTCHVPHDMCALNWRFGFGPGSAWENIWTGPEPDRTPNEVQGSGSGKYGLQTGPNWTTATLKGSDVTFLPWTAPDSILTDYDYGPSYIISHGLVIKWHYHMYDTDSFLGLLY